MLIIVTLKDGKQLEWQYGLHTAIDKMVEAIKENCDWATIVVHIARAS